MSDDCENDDQSQERILKVAGNLVIFPRVENGNKTEAEAEADFERASPSHNWAQNAFRKELPPLHHFQNDRVEEKEERDDGGGCEAGGVAVPSTRHPPTHIFKVKGEENETTRRTEQGEEAGYQKLPVKSPPLTKLLHGSNQSPNSPRHISAQPTTPSASSSQWWGAGWRRCVVVGASAGLEGHSTLKSFVLEGEILIGFEQFWRIAALPLEAICETF